MTVDPMHKPSSPQGRGMRRSFDATAPLEKASTPPALWYTAADVAERERESVFARTWQFAAPSAWLRDPGSYVTTTVAGEAVLLVRGQDARLRAMSNVCRHRASPVATAPRGSCRAFRCPYHGWTYGTDGALHAAPECEGVEDFDPSSVRLPPIAVEEAGPFVFVCLAEAPPPFLPGALRHRLCDGTDDLVHVDRRVYVVESNWKVYVDNYLDGGYHIPRLHPLLHQFLDYASYRTELGEGWNVQHSATRRADDPSNAPGVGALRAGVDAEYYWLFPNFTVNRYAGIIDTNLVRPTSPASCEVVFDYWFPAGASEASVARSIEVSEQIQAEDRDICARVQRNLGSRFFDTGRYSVRREGGEHQFHQLLARALGEV